MVHVLDVCFFKVLKKMFELCACVCPVLLGSTECSFVCAPSVSDKKSYVSKHEIHILLKLFPSISVNPV